MSSTLPRLRKDLTISRQETADGTYFVIKEELSGKFFRFREAEHFIAEQLDGETSPEVVRQRAEVQFGAKLSAETMSLFIGKLKKAGLLETGEQGVQKGVARGRIRGNLLYLRFKIFDPSRLFTYLNRKVPFFYTPAFVAISATLILFSIWTTIEYWNEFARDLDRLFNFATVPLFLAISLVVVTAHEFAHGITCRHFGGQVREVGFMLMYFQPAFYCNVSDAWLFPEKSKRLWVGFAGPYFELFLWALATMAWRMTEVDTWINYVALIIMATSGIKTLVNFNPLVKLDGYYLLSDYLNIPNLRRKSFRYVGDLVRKLTGGSVQSTETLSARERRVFFLYGVIATAFSFFFLGYAIMQVGGLLIRADQPVPLAVFFGFVGLRFRDRLVRLFGGGTGKEKGYHGKSLWAPSTRTSTTPTATKPGPSKSPDPQKKRPRGLQRRTKLLIGAYAGVLAILILIFGWMELKVGGPFMILPVHNADVRSEIDGIVQEIYVTEGDIVKAGDRIARLSDHEYRTELEKTAAELQQSRARLKMLVIGPTRQEIELAQIAVDRARGRLQYALSRSDRNKLLFDKNMLSRVEFENSQEQTTMAQGDLSEAQRKLDVLRVGARPEQIDDAKGEIARLEVEERHLKEILTQVEVRSPAAGVVATPKRQLEALVGQAVQKGALIAKVFDFKKLTVEMAVSEKEIADVKVGEMVAFKAKAYPDRTFYGTVTSTATTAQSGSSSADGNMTMSVLSSSGTSTSSILVTTVIDNSSRLLKPGMTGQAKILCGDRRILELFQRRVSRTVKIEFWSWW